MNAIRQSPANVDAEECVIGSVMIDPDTLAEVVTVLPDPGMFFRASHARIWAEVVSRYSGGLAIDAVTLADALGPGGLDEIGGIETLARIANATPHAANAQHYAVIVREKSLLRQLIGASEETIRDAYAGQETAAEVLDRAASRVFAVHDEGVVSRLARAGEVVPEVLETIDARRERRSIGLRTGFAQLDVVLCGLKPESLYILAARPAMGKSAFGMGVCEHNALDVGIPCLFVSLEMSRGQLVERLAVSRSRIDGMSAQSGRFAPDDFGRFGDAIDEIRRAPLFLDDTPGMGMLQVAASARRVRMRERIGLIVIDYIQLVEPDNARENRQEQVAKVSRRLKAMARELKVPIVALCQLNRKVEDREEKVPRLADLRDSGSIEQDADVVILLHRPEYYDASDSPGVARLIVAKNRHGPTSTVELTWLARSVRFENRARENPDFGPAPGGNGQKPF